MDMMVSFSFVLGQGHRIGAALPARPGGIWGFGFGSGLLWLVLFSSPMKEG
jgi:hypothetical protein